MGTKSQSEPGKYNITRALKSYKDVENPFDALTYVADNIHAVVFKTGNDILRLIRNNAN